MNSTNRPLKWVNISFLFGTLAAALILTPLYLRSHSFDARLLWMAIAFAFATGMSITGGYHRLFAHRSYETRTWVKVLYLLLGAASFQGSAMEWCSDHRRHHRFVDTDKDPYSIGNGFFYAHMGWLFYKEPADYEKTFGPDLMKDPWVRFQYRHYKWIAIAMGFGVPMLLGWMIGDVWGGLIFPGLLRIIFVQHATFFINSLCHTIGTRPYTESNTARDSWIMALLTYGEGYHNYHHYFQADYRNGVRWYQYDPTKWMIATLALFGQASKLRRVGPHEIQKARFTKPFGALASHPKVS